MKFYAYKGQYKLGNEMLGTEGRILFNLKTIRGAMNRCDKAFGKDFTLYSYINFYDDDTFKRLYPKE